MFIVAARRSFRQLIAAKVVLLDIAAHEYGTPMILTHHHPEDVEPEPDKRMPWTYPAPSGSGRHS
jgi:hypothetical protein